MINELNTELLKCFDCKNEMINSTTTHFVDLKKCIVIIKNVPCSVSKLMTEIAVIDYTDNVA